MKDYSKGKIYKIVSFETDDIYIGSTIQPLSKRMTTHRSQYKAYVEGAEYCCSSKYILEQDPFARIVLIKNFSCNSKDELNAEELVIIQATDCVNRKKGQTADPDYYRDHAKSNYDKKREEILAKRCEKYKANSYDILRSKVVRNLNSGATKKPSKASLQKYSLVFDKSENRWI